MISILGAAPLLRFDENGIWPRIEVEEREAVNRALEAGILYSGLGGPEVTQLERTYHRSYPLRISVATSSCTAALHLAAEICCFFPGEVIVPALTFSGTTHPFAQAGYDLVFADVDRRTFNLCPEALEAAITPNTVGIVPVHLHGLPADMSRIMELSEKRGLWVVEDACQAHGATINGVEVGNFGEVACFSFSSSKPITGGQGGMMVIGEADMAMRAIQLRSYGEDVGAFNETRTYVSHAIGYNYMLDELSAALINAMLPKLARYNSRAQHNARILGTELSECVGLTVPFVPAGFTHIYHKYRLVFDPAQFPSGFRTLFYKALQAENVPVSYWQFVPVPHYPVFQDTGAYPNTEFVLANSIIIGDERNPGSCAIQVRL